MLRTVLTISVADLLRARRLHLGVRALSLLDLLRLEPMRPKPGGQKEGRSQHESGKSHACEYGEPGVLRTIRKLHVHIVTVVEEEERHHLQSKPQHEAAHEHFSRLPVPKDADEHLSQRQQGGLLGTGGAFGAYGAFIAVHACQWGRSGGGGGRDDRGVKDEG